MRGVAGVQPVTLGGGAAAAPAAHGDADGDGAGENAAMAAVARAGATEGVENVDLTSWVCASHLAWPRVLPHVIGRLDLEVR